MAESQGPVRFQASALPAVPPEALTRPKSPGPSISIEGVVLASHQLLTSREVHLLLSIDRSTVCRMAEDGRLPGVKIGRQWRFRAQGVLAMLGTRDAPGSAIGSLRPAPLPAGPALDPVNREVADPVLTVASQLLGVMMLVTDMSGRPVTPVANPCAWFEGRSADPDVLEACSAKWRAMAADPDLSPRFRTGRLGLECAQSFIRAGTRLVGMVLAGGVAPPTSSVRGLYHLSAEERGRVLNALPRVSAALSRVATS